MQIVRPAIQLDQFYIFAGNDWRYKYVGPFRTRNHAVFYPVHECWTDKRVISGHELQRIADEDPAESRPRLTSLIEPPHRHL